MPFQNDVGTVVEVQILEDGEVFPIPVGATLQIRLEKPNGQVITRPATVQTDGSDGWIEYVIIAGDFDQVGIWYAEGHVAYGGGSWSSEIGQFEVKRILRNKRG